MIDKIFVLFQYIVGKKFIGYPVFDNNYSKIRKIKKILRETNNYEAVSNILFIQSLNMHKLNFIKI